MILGTPVILGPLRVRCVARCALAADPSGMVVVDQSRSLASRESVGPRFNVGVEGARMGGFGSLAGADGRGGAPAYSVQVRGQVGF